MNYQSASFIKKEDRLQSLRSNIRHQSLSRKITKQSLITKFDQIENQLIQIVLCQSLLFIAEGFYYVGYPQEQEGDFTTFILIISGFIMLISTLVFYRLKDDIEIDLESPKQQIILMILVMIYDFFYFEGLCTNITKKLIGIGIFIIFNQNCIIDNIINKYLRNLLFFLISIYCCLRILFIFQFNVFNTVLASCCILLLMIYIYINIKNPRKNILQLYREIDELKLAFDDIKGFYSGMFNLLSEGMALINDKKEVIYFNKVILNMFKCTDQNLLKTIMDLQVQSKYSEIENEQKESEINIITNKKKEMKKYDTCTAKTIRNSIKTYSNHFAGNAERENQEDDQISIIKKNNFINSERIQDQSSFESIFSKLIQTQNKEFKKFSTEQIPNQKNHSIKKSSFQVNEGNIEFQIKLGDKVIRIQLALCQYKLWDCNTRQQIDERGIFIFCQDITKELNIKKLEGIEQYKQKVLVSISHQLKTPLNCSITMLELLYNNNEIKENLRKQFVLPALCSNELMNNLVYDLCDYAEFSTGKFQLEIVQFKLKQLLAECIFLYSLQSNMKGIKLEIQYDEAIPQYINSDPQRIRQVVLILLSNSIKFTQKGSVTVKATWEGQNLIQIQVFDTGVGLNTAMKLQVEEKLNSFESQIFLQGSQRNYGLGLTIAGKIIKGLSNNRKIQVETEEGEGTKFSFVIVNQQSNIRFLKLKRMSVFQKHIHNWSAMNTMNEKEHTQILKKEIQKEEDTIQKNINMLMQNNNNTNINSNNNISTKNQLSQPSIKKTFTKMTSTISECYLTQPSKMQMEMTNPDSSQNRNEEIESCNINQMESHVSDLPNLDLSIRLQQKNEKHLLRQICNNIPLNQMMCNKSNTSQITINSPTQQQLKQSFSIEESNFEEDEEEEECSSSEDGVPSPIPQNQEQHPQSVEESKQASNSNNSILRYSNKYCKYQCPQRKCNKILIVDDNGFNLYALKNLLHIYKYLADTAENGEVAVDKIINKYNTDPCCKSYRLILMDIDMPFKNGYQASEEIFQFYKGKASPPIICACTAYVGEEDQLKAKSVGMQQFLKKPIDKSELEKLLSKMFK